MPGAARLGDGYSCGDVQAVGSGNVFVNGMPFARVGDSTAGHGCYPSAVLSIGASTVFVNGIPAGKNGDTNGGHVNGKPCDVFHVGVMVSGSTDVFVE